MNLVQEITANYSYNYDSFTLLEQTNELPIILGVTEIDGLNQLFKKELKGRYIPYIKGKNQ